MTLFSSLLSALFAFANRHYEDAPNAGQVVRLARADETWLQWRFMGNVLSAIEANGRKLGRKARSITWSLAMLIATVAQLGGYFVYASWTRRLGGS